MKKPSKLQLAQQNTEIAVKKTNDKISELGIHAGIMYESLMEIQRLFDCIRNIPSEEKIRYEKLKEKTMKSTTVDGGVEIPLICGDTKEAITLFDREYMSIEISNQAGDLWNKDQTGVKVRDRFDVQATDVNAIVKAKVTVANAG